MIQLRNKRVREDPIVMSGTTFTPVSAHSEALLATRWGSFGIVYRRPAWIEIEETRQRVPIRDVVAMTRALAVALAFLLLMRRSGDD